MDSLRLCSTLCTLILWILGGVYHFLWGKKQNSACHFILYIHSNAVLFKILRELAQKQELKCGYILPGNKKGYHETSACPFCFCISVQTPLSEKRCSVFRSTYTLAGSWVKQSISLALMLLDIHMCLQPTITLRTIWLQLSPKGKVCLSTSSLKIVICFLFMGIYSYMSLHAPCLCSCLQRFEGGNWSPRNFTLEKLLWVTWCGDWEPNLDNLCKSTKYYSPLSLLSRTLNLLHNVGLAIDFCD